ncbi:MAG: hypothetical protein Q8941_07655 [Bacteroidota bacterium]|nr:hypothetical protein [Bacteroidota bacterium]
MKPILLLLLSPSFVSAQVIRSVEPVETKDYINMIRRHGDTANNNNVSPADSINSVRNANLTLRGIFNPAIAIKRININNGNIKIYSNYSRRLVLSGSYSSVASIKTTNRLPGLQNNFVQGGPANGELRWLGPETGEMFSFGPDIHALEFDGSSYPYDQNGKLVATGSGNGNPAQIYHSNIFRTAASLSQSLNIQSTLYRAAKNTWTFNVKLGQTGEHIYIRDNKNSSKTISASIGTVSKSLSLSGNYSYSRDKFSNSNRNGFLNRVYQNSLLTPISFSATQGNTLTGNIQRSYSHLADNPFFLLDNNGNSFLQSQHHGNVVLEEKTNSLKFKVIQSLESVQQKSIEQYKEGTAYFPGGIATGRKKNDLSYLLTASAWGDINYSNYRYHSTLSVNYIFTGTRSAICYSINSQTYSYQRSSNDVNFSYLTLYRGHNIEAGIDLTNKFYYSNTSGKGSYFLPAVNSYARLNNIFDYFDIKLNTAVNHFKSELPVDKSFAHINLLRYSTQDAFQYFPLGEVTGFDNLKVIDHFEWTGKLELWYKNNISLSGEVFIRNTRHDVFPVYKNGDWVLKNIADHRKKGIELQLSSYRLPFSPKKFSVSNTLSFTSYQNRVTKVGDGYNFTPIAGFSNINKVIAAGEPLGAIAGSSYVRDASNNILIGNDGYPLVNNQPKIIGDPTPDFIMKLSNSMNWKKFTLCLDMEWKKGGDVWNGTQAALDYYGRSQTSAMLRNTTNYIFPGYLQDGHINNIPVNFYDPALPLDKNRWVRYGLSGIAEEYIQKGDNIRLNTLSLGYKLNFRKYIQQLTVGIYLDNIILWTAYKGADPNQLLYDQPNGSGLDFFNLPSTKTFGFTTSIQF